MIDIAQMEGEVTVRKAEYSGFGGFFRKLTRTKVKKEESSAGLSKCLTLTHLVKQKTSKSNNT